MDALEFLFKADRLEAYPTLFSFHSRQDRLEAYPTDVFKRRSGG